MRGARPGDSGVQVWAWATVWNSAVPTQQASARCAEIEEARVCCQSVRSGGQRSGMRERRVQGAAVQTLQRLHRFRVRPEVRVQVGPGFRP
jgi:hypothetical protein